MTYETREQSLDSGQPFELYKFVGPLASYFHTSRPVNVEFDGDTYTPIQLDRTSIDIVSNLSQVKTMDFIIPVNSTIAQVYTGANVPSSLSVEVFRCHVGLDVDAEAFREWYGEAVGYTVRNQRFHIKTRSVLQAQASLNTDGVFYQYGCNNKVYDDRCQANKASFTTTTTIEAIDGPRITVANDGNANGELALGTATNKRTNEIRSISNNTDNLVILTYPFVDVEIGDQVDLVLGCDNRMSTCINRFNNVEHYTGFRYIPTRNPYEGL